MLNVKNGCFSYGNRSILNDVSFTVEDNDIFAILGRNGAGKTTLLKCIMNFLPWQHGEALFDGRDIKSIPSKELWRNIAYVPQAKRGTDCKARDMVVMGRSAHIGLFDMPKKEDYAIAESVMEKLYIKDIAEKSCACLSGGELQLVLIARALATKPKLLIMDEPESNLDYHNQLHMLGLISEISKDTACILNTHYPEHALRYASKALLLTGDGNGITGAVDEVITETNLRTAFNIDVCIGQTRIGMDSYKYIIPLHKH